MKKKLSILTIFIVAAMMVGCAKTDESSANANLSANANSTAATTAPDNSEITTSVDASGTKTETRVFRNNPRVAKVVVTTHNGTRTVKVYSPSGEEREIKSNDENVLEATGDKIADGAGFVANKSVDAAGATKDKAEEIGDKTVDKSKEVGSKTVEGAKTVGDKTAEGAKTVGSKTVEGAKTVGDKTVEGAKVVGDKTAEGAKKAGKAVKKIIP